MDRLAALEAFVKVAESQSFSEAARRLRTSKSVVSRHVAGLEAGANDYVTKPFSVPELVARLRSHLRTSIRRNGMRRIEIPVGDLVIDVDARRVCRSGEDLRLSPTEYRLLTCLAENMGSVVSHDTLAAAIWERDGARLAPHLKIYVRRLRQKIEVDPANPRVIQSRHGAGYLIANTAS